MYSLSSKKNPEKANHKAEIISEKQLAADTSNGGKQDRLITIQAYLSLLESDIVKAKNIHYQAVYQELNWLLQVIWCRLELPNSKQDFKSFFGKQDFQKRTIQLPAPIEGSHYYAWLKKYDLLDHTPVRLLLATALSTQRNDALLSPLLELLTIPVLASFLGGHLQASGRRFLPDIQTILYLLAGTNLQNQGVYLDAFKSRKRALRDWGIVLESVQAMRIGYSDIADKWKNLLISLDPAVEQYFLGGAMPQPEENQQLPLTLLQSELQMDELVLADRVREQLQPVLTFAKKGQDFFKNNQLSKGFRKGFVVLLYGEPGTGKTLIASTLGKHVGLKTYQLEVAQVISKYIGETSQNMEKVFDELERAIDWLEGQPSILFIDEADAIMGKRSEVKDSKDRYANLDTSFLLQRLEKFPGLVILATNFPQNLDEAFKRRIQTQILVPKPEKEQRVQLWKNYLPAAFTYPEVSFTEDFAALLGEKFNLTGAQINNILKQATLMAFSEKESVLDFERFLEPAIIAEWKKVDKVYNRPEGIVPDPKEVQKQLWVQHLPEGWQYVPAQLPQILSRCVLLPEEALQELLQKAQQQAQNQTLDYQTNLKPLLGEWCSYQQLDWTGIALTIESLLPKEEESQEVKAKPTKQDPKKLKVLEEKAAVSVWKQALPKDFSFALESTAQKLADFYELNTYEIEEIIEMAVAKAQKEETKQLVYSKHLQLALKELEMASQRESLYRSKVQKQMARAEQKKKRKLLPLRYSPTGTNSQYWYYYLPDHCRFGTARMGAILNEHFKVNELEIEWIVGKAVELAAEEGKTEISYSDHIGKAIAELKAKLGVELKRSSRNDNKRPDLKKK